VSIYFIRSKFVTTFSGTYIPTPAIKLLGIRSFYDCGKVKEKSCKQIDLENGYCFKLFGLRKLIAAFDVTIIPETFGAILLMNPFE